MKNTPITIIVDSDAIIAQANENDFHHKNAVKISEKLSSISAKIIYPATTIAESTAYMQRALGSSATAYGTAIFAANPNVNIAEINQDTLKIANKYLSPLTSKKNTLFDCIILAIAEKYEADAIFSFDKFYKKNGFKLASEL